NIHNVMIYQSMSGDADSGISVFSMTNGSLTANAGEMIYVTNTSCEIDLTNVTLDLFNNVLLDVAGNDGSNGWGTVGSNGGQCVFTANDQVLTGDINVDAISSLDMTMSNGSTFSGSINSANSGGTINVTLDSTSKWTLTADSYVTSLSGTTTNVDTNGFTLYVNGVAQK
ncbi:MAG: hypothetical protein HGA22_02415, partial [Clostridiales bacterium]|nr:hypothetical protein [Clostridiales bacterium]